MEKNQKKGNLQACINTQGNETWLSIYTVNSDGKLTGNEESLFLKDKDNSGWYKIQTKEHGRVFSSYSEGGISYDRYQSFEPEIDFNKRTLNRDDLEAIEENKALFAPVENMKAQQIKEYMYKKIEDLEKSGVPVKRLTP